jgi:hypothetical protein
VVRLDGRDLEPSPSGFLGALGAALDPPAGAPPLQGARVEGGSDSPVYAYVAQTTRTLLPLMERTGVATAAEVGVDTLAARLREEVVAADAVVVPPPLIGAWARKPA